MLSILKHFHSYILKKSDGDYDGQLFAGDQLTLERAVNVVQSVANGYSPEDRLEGINLQLGDWHAAVKLLTVSIFFYPGFINYMFLQTVRKIGFLLGLSLLQCVYYYYFG